MNRTPAVSLLLLAALAVPMGAAAKSSDRNQPIDVDAGTSDCSVSDERLPCLLTSGVTITQGTLEIQATRADLRRSNGEFQRVILNGSPVKMKQQMDDGGWVDATAAQADYNMPSDTVVLTGNAVVNQPGQGKIEGQRIVYNMSTGRVQGGGEGQGRVRMQFQPRTPQPAQPAAQGGR
ncbi:MULTISPECIES: lipopolysaccharide transport periplasmic protein LptA [Luteimonas]|uniref:Lipopolysaccharide export system protein LptA n=1 Tax=Luteimonas chenhongjianii TaxID=2006110 RepID=A0A290XGT7_9GAMM|nr:MULTISPECIES: lipopolysaccharide transport periplasmic protein LptA [Luteimonas]ATD68293.1 lipopolysaccharide transport periplasmic protein LptA [Luteimonas chenhongjianii]RPD88026.1 lipopolysaccharide transport periplasmic protein LptA [Luteimonas sp. 100069]